MMPRDRQDEDAAGSSSRHVPPRHSFGPMHSDPNSLHEGDEARKSSASSFGPNSFCDPSTISTDGSPMRMSPWNQTTPYSKSEWSQCEDANSSVPQTGLIGSLVREEGHIYSLAVKNGLLYTGSDSKNIRVWKDLKEHTAFKSNSGLVKAIVISGDKIFSGHQDGKIRVWKVTQNVHKRYGTLPTRKEIFKCSIKPSNYVQVRKTKRSALWIKHSDAIACLSLNEPLGLLYSASWDRTFKVWRMSDSKCLESVNAHDDAVNAVVAGLDAVVFSGAADGSVKVWKREVQGWVVKHVYDKTLLKLECAVTALTMSPKGEILYCGSSDGLVNFWEREKQLAHGGVLKGHKQAVHCLETAGNLVFSGSADKTTCIWRRDGAMHTCLSVLTGHTAPVKCFAVELDRESSKANDQRWKLYTGGLDKSVKVWSVSDQAVDFGAMIEMMMAGSEGAPAWDTASSDYSFSSQGGRAHQNQRWRY